MPDGLPEVGMVKRRRSWRHQIGKWSTTVACAVVVGVCVAQCWFVGRVSDDYTWAVWLYFGRVELDFYTPATPGSVKVARWSSPKGTRTDDVRLGRVWARVDSLDSALWKQEWYRDRWCEQLPKITFVEEANFYEVNVPLWPFLVASLWGTGWFWLHRGVEGNGGGCVRCGYDLTGNVSGVCPECGTKVLAVHRADASPAGPKWS